MTEAQQGHKYAWQGREVLALSNGEFPRVAVINRAALWLLESGFAVNASSLEALPMRYFHGATPA